MYIYHYPSYKQEDITKKIINHIMFFLMTISSFFLENSMFFWLICIQWLMSITDDTTDYKKRKNGWLVKLDNEFIYFYNLKNRTPISSIYQIKRQCIQGENFGISLVFKNFHVQSEQFSILNNEQLDELVAFLNRSIF